MIALINATSRHFRDVKGFEVFRMHGVEEFLNFHSTPDVKELQHMARSIAEMCVKRLPEIRDYGNFKHVGVLIAGPSILVPFMKDAIEDAHLRVYFPWSEPKIFVAPDGQHMTQRVTSKYICVTDIPFDRRSS